MHVKETSDPYIGAVLLYAMNFIDASGYDGKKRKNEKDLKNATRNTLTTNSLSGALFNSLKFLEHLRCCEEIDG